MRYYRSEHGNYTYRGPIHEYIRSRRKRPQNGPDRFFTALVVLAVIAALGTMIYGVSSMCHGKKETYPVQIAENGERTDNAAEEGQNGNSDPNEPDAAEPQETDDYEPVPEIDPVTAKALDISSSMSTEDKIGLLILPRGDNMEFDQFTELISDIHAGGAVLFKKDFTEKSKKSVKKMTAKLQEAGGGHMLLCVDEEGGTVVRISSNENLRESKFKSPQYLYNHGGMDAIASDTREKCRFLLDLGVNVNFAPVSDVVTDEEGFLYPRAFGKNAQETAEYVGVVTGIMKEEHVGCSLKHFPGYGNAHGDTHEGLVESAVTEQSLWDSDLVPFAEGIAKGADSIMVTHTIVSCIDPDRPCSMSPAAISLLRERMGFDGVVVTDGLDMGAITKFCNGGDPCVQAVLAGADLMCTPSDSRASYKALLDAYNSGVITPERLEESVMRILKWKIDLGLYQ